MDGPPVPTNPQFPPSKTWTSYTFIRGKSCKHASQQQLKKIFWQTPFPPQNSKKVSIVFWKVRVFWAIPPTFWGEPTWKSNVDRYFAIGYGRLNHQGWTLPVSSNTCVAVLRVGLAALARVSTWATWCVALVTRWEWGVELQGHEALGLGVLRMFKVIKKHLKNHGARKNNQVIDQTCIPSLKVIYIAFESVTIFCLGNGKWYFRVDFLFHLHPWGWGKMDALEVERYFFNLYWFRGILGGLPWWGTWVEWDCRVEITWRSVQFFVTSINGFSLGHSTGNVELCG